MTETPDLKPASESPWYVLMTVAGEQTGFLIDDDFHARNLRFWDGWAGGSLSDTAKAAPVAEGRRLLHPREHREADRRDHRAVPWPHP